MANATSAFIYMGKITAIMVFKLKSFVSKLASSAVDKLTGMILGNVTWYSNSLAVINYLSFFFLLSSYYYFFFLSFVFLCLSFVISFSPLLVGRKEGERRDPCSNAGYVMYRPDGQHESALWISGYSRRIHHQHRQVHIPQHLTKICLLH